MKRARIGLFAALMFVVPAFASTAQAESVAQEAAEHPRIVTAIRELEEAIKYMEAAPHNFGGHKAASIQACRAAIQQLNLALRFRAAADTRKGK